MAELEETAKILTAAENKASRTNQVGTLDINELPDGATTAAIAGNLLNPISKSQQEDVQVITSSSLKANDIQDGREGPRHNRMKVDVGDIFMVPPPEDAPNALGARHQVDDQNHIPGPQTEAVSSTQSPRPHGVQQ